MLVILFGMEGCPACEAYLPVFRAVARRHPGVPAYAVDCNLPGSQADAVGVTVTPTTILFQRGQVVKRFEGEGSRADVEKLFGYAEQLAAGGAALDDYGFRRR